MRDTTTEQLSSSKLEVLVSFINMQHIPLPILRKVLKASIAMLISLILVLVNKTRLMIGPASTLATLGVLLYFPTRPVGTYLTVMNITHTGY